MAPRKKTERVQEEFGKSLYTVLAEMDKSYDVSSGVIWQRSSRPGVFTVIIRASRFSSDTGKRRQVARISGEWPNAGTTDVVAFLYGMALKLEHMLSDDSRLDILPD